MSVGDPGTDDEIGMGPVISAEQKQRVLGFVERAKAAKASDGRDGRGHGRRPRLLHRADDLVADVAQDAEIVQNEVFGRS